MSQFPQLYNEGVGLRDHSRFFQFYNSILLFHVVWASGAQLTLIIYEGNYPKRVLEPNSHANPWNEGSGSKYIAHHSHPSSPTKHTHTIALPSESIQ